jgi:hypothetical protein
MKKLIDKFENWLLKDLVYYNPNEWNNDYF